MKIGLNSMRMKIISALIPLFLLSGCISLLPDSGPEARLHELKPSASKGHIQSKVVLSIDEPITGLALSGRGIAVEKTSEEGQKYISYVKGHLWSDPLPIMLQNYLVESLRSEEWPEIYHDNAPGNVDYYLRSNITEFNIVDPNMVSIVIFFSLIDNKTKKSVSTKSINIKRGSESSVTAFLSNLNGALNELRNDLEIWIADSIKRNNN